MATILMNYALGATLTLCPYLIAFGLSARELCKKAFCRNKSEIGF